MRRFPFDYPFDNRPALNGAIATILAMLAAALVIGLLP